MSNWRSSELGIFLWYVFAVFRPGAMPPQHPNAQEKSTPPAPDLDAWSEADLDVYLQETRRMVDQQQADKTDIRGRAQVILTTGLVLGGAIVADFSSRTTTGAWVATSSAIAFCLVLASALGAGGILTAQSPIGVPSMDYVEGMDRGNVKRAVARGYSATRAQGAGTVALMVTALRDSTFALVVGFMIAALAHFLPGAA